MIALITTGIPFVTALIKKVFKTDQLNGTPQKGIHLLIPAILGIFSSGLYAYSHGQDWITALAIGLGSGGAVSSARDIEKNMIGIAEAIARLTTKEVQLTRRDYCLTVSWFAVLAPKKELLLWNRW